MCGDFLVYLFVCLFVCLFVFSFLLELQRHAKINDKNRRFGVFMTPLSLHYQIFWN